MQPPTKSQQQQWMAPWRSAAVALERVRVAELATADLDQIARHLDDGGYVGRNRATTTSGLVDQQRLFSRARR